MPIAVAFAFQIYMRTQRHNAIKKIQKISEDCERGPSHAAHTPLKAPAAGVEQTRKGFAAMTTEPIEIEDLLAALKAGRKPRDHGPYKVQVGDHDLKFSDAIIDDPTPTGRQIIEGAGFRKAETHLVFQVLRNGELEELRLEETTDLRPGQVERFLVFPSAESFRFDIDGKRLEWG